MIQIDQGGQPADAVRYPRAFLKIGEAKIPVLRATVTRKATRHADTFSAETSVAEAALFGFDYAQWADWDPDQDVSVVMSTKPGGADEVVMVTGKCDMPVIEMDKMLVSVGGRDKSASLTEKKRNQKFVNQKSSDIVSTIAKDHGLNPVIADSGDFAGKQYTQDLASLALNRSDYEILSQLATREGYRWYVEGDDLVFEPKETGSYATYAVRWSPPGTVAPYAIGNVLTLRLGRDSTASRPQRVTAAGWHHGKKRLYKSSVEASGRGTPVEHRLHHNGHTQDQLDKKAKSFARDMVRHELNLTATMPGDPTLDPHMGLSLSGTGTLYDTTYQIDEIQFDFDEDSLAMTVHGKGSVGDRVR